MYRVPDPITFQCFQFDTSMQDSPHRKKGKPLFLLVFHGFFVTTFPGTKHLLELPLVSIDIQAGVVRHVMMFFNTNTLEI